MAERKPVPESWAGRKVHVRYTDADVPRWLDCTLEEAGEHGVVVAADGRTTFFPWGSIVRIDLGHGDPARARGR